MALRSSILITLHIVKLAIKKDDVNRMCGTKRKNVHIQTCDWKIIEVYLRTRNRLHMQLT